MTSPSLIAFAVAATTLAAAPALAGQRHSRAPAYADDQAAPYAYAEGWEGAAIARATREMRNAPGVTNELDPTAKATATGGPAGGVPNFSGH